MLLWTWAACTTGSAPPAAEPPPEPPPEVVHDDTHLASAPGPSGGVSDATSSAWWPGAELAVAVDGANLRAGPSTDAAVVAELALAAPVEVLAVDETPIVATERRNVWVRVRAGEREGWL